MSIIFYGLPISYSKQKPWKLPKVSNISLELLVSNMKTYKPKRPVYHEIENVEELCRLCLERSKDGIPIFKHEQDVCAAVAMRIMICVGLEMTRDDSLPNKICRICYEELEKYYKFRRKCEVSYHKLKQHLLAMKQKFRGSPKNMESSIEHTQPPSEVVEEKQQDVKSVIEKVPEDEKQLTIHFAEETAEVMDIKKVVETEETQMPVQAEINPDIATFLSGILTELGILQRQEAGLVLHRGVSTLHLDTGDGQQLLLELVEDDETTLNILDEQQEVKRRADSQEGVDLVIKEEKPVTADITMKLEPQTKGSKASRPWCSVCGRAFSSRSAAARHTRVHSGLRPYTCTCGATFAQKAVLQRHMLVHLDVRPHRCEQCGKSFTQRGALVVHARTHAAPAARPLALHRCTLCDKVFLYGSGLSRHMFTHEGRVFECSACDKQFRDKSSLARHVRNVYHKPTHEPAHVASNNIPAGNNTLPATNVTGDNLSSNMTVDNASGCKMTVDNVSESIIIDNIDNVSGCEMTVDNVSGCKNDG